MIQDVNNNVSTSEEMPSSNLYAVDYLRVVVNINNHPQQLSQVISIPFIKHNGDYYQGSESFRKQFVKGSFSNQIQIKSLDESSLLIEGNLYKWLNGQNVTGTLDLKQLVFNTVTNLAHIYDSITPTEQQLNDVKNGVFKIHRIDLAKALVFESKLSAEKYLLTISEYGQRARNKKEVENNGVYFNKTSKRVSTVYYHKGNEVKSHPKHQANITPEIQAQADLTIRCEVRFRSQQLRDDELNWGYAWDDRVIMDVVDNYHSLLKLPEKVSLEHLPDKLAKFVLIHQSGHVDRYSMDTVKRYKRELAHDYGWVL